MDLLDAGDHPDHALHPGLPERMADGGLARLSCGARGMISMTLPQYRRRQCVINGRKVRLGPMFNEALSLLLVAGPDRFVCRTELIEALWPNPDFSLNRNMPPRWWTAASSAFAAMA